MKTLSTVLIILLSLFFGIVSPKTERVRTVRTIHEFVFQGVSISYDAAGNRVLRSSMPQIGLPETEAPQPIDTMVTHAPDPSGDETGPVEEP